MGVKATVMDVAVGESVLGHIEDDAIHFANGRGTIVGDAARQLKELLGQGYGRRQFHLVLVACKLLNCRVVSPHVVFTYDTMQPLDEDEAPPTVPEYIVDEDTPMEIPPSG